MDNQFKLWIKDEMKAISVDISEKQTEQFYQYYTMLIEWNKVMNLTAITDMSQVISKHFVDSLTLVKAVPELLKSDSVTENDDRLKVMDLGTGAGFPGIPLKIVFPGLRITLADSLNKRINFLNEVISALGLTKIETIHGRAEYLGRDGAYREKYDLCVSRAVANLSTLSEYCIPFVKQGGYFIAYKSGNIEEELLQAKKAIGILGSWIEDVIAFRLPGADAERSLVKVKKISGISMKYPRKAGVPGKEPLK